MVTDNDDKKLISIEITKDDVGAQIPVKGSAAGQFSKEDAVKALRDVGYVVLASLLAYSAHYLKIADFGEYGVIIIPIATLVIDGGRRWLKNNQRIDIKDIVNE